MFDPNNDLDRNLDQANHTLLGSINALEERLKSLRESLKQDPTGEEASKTSRFTSGYFAQSASVLEATLAQLGCLHFARDVYNHAEAQIGSTDEPTWEHHNG